MTSRRSINVSGVVQNVSLHKETNALVTYKVKDILNDNVYELLCLRYRSEDRDGFVKTHMNIHVGDHVEATGYLRKRVSGESFISVTRIYKVEKLRVTIPDIPLTIYNGKFVYQGETYGYASVDMGKANQMTITSEDKDVKITISEQGFEHTSFFVKSNKHEDVSYDLMENIPYYEIAKVIAGDVYSEDFSEIPLYIKNGGVVYQGKKFKYKDIEMDKPNMITLRLKNGPVIVVTRQGPGHVGVMVNKNKFEEFEGDGYDIMFEADYEELVANVFV